MTSAVEERTSTARYVMSPRLPMGVLTRNSIPAAPVPALAELTSRAAAGIPLRGGARVLLELLRQRRLAHEADHLIDELAVLEEENCRNRPDVELRRGLDVHVDIDLGDLGLALILDGQLVQHRRDHAARGAPGGPEVHDGE